MEAPDSANSYVLCIDNGGYPESLEVRKLYAVLPDERAAANDYIRVIDETGEDYLYPAKYFVPILLPPEVARILPAGSALRSPANRSRLLEAVADVEQNRNLVTPDQEQFQ